jgi:glycosyltransferase involved in cell wall biosynthesis
VHLSIITINLNNRNGLAKTIVSIIEQVSNDYEFIVIDGGSYDGSKELLQSYGQSITYWVSEPDNGIYHAMNKGIAKATGEFCLFVNSGDILFNKHVIKDICKCDLNAEIISGHTYVGKSGTELQFVKAQEKISFYTFYNHTILHQSTLIKTALFRTVGYYNENLSIVADWEFLLKALFIHRCKYKSINVTLSVFDNSGISSDPGNFGISRLERDMVLNEYFPLFLSDYQLLRPHSTFLFLGNLQRNRFSFTVFTFFSRAINWVFKLKKR